MTTDIVVVETPVVETVVIGTPGPTGLTGPRGPTGPTSGHVWNSCEPVVITGTAERSQLSPVGIGSPLLPAGFWEYGKRLQYRTRGYIAAANTQMTTFKITVGGVTLVESAVTLPNGLTGGIFYVEAVFDMLCTVAGAGGKLNGIGRTLIQTVQGIGGLQARTLLTTDILTGLPSDISVDLSADTLFGCTYRWHSDNASNKLTLAQSGLSLI